MTIGVTRRELVLKGTAVMLVTGNRVAMSGLEKAMDSTSEVNTLLDSWCGSVRAKDIDRLMSLYSPEIVYFDCVPPLQGFIGADAVSIATVTVDPTANYSFVATASGSGVQAVSSVGSVLVQP